MINCTHCQQSLLYETQTKNHDGDGWKQKLVRGQVGMDQCMGQVEMYVKKVWEQIKMVLSTHPHDAI